MGGVLVLLLFSSASLFALAKSGPDFRFSGSFSSRFGGGVSVEGTGTASGSGGASLVALSPSGMSKFLPSFFRRTPLKVPNQGNLCSRALRASCSLFSFRENSLILRRLENHAAASFSSVLVSILARGSHQAEFDQGDPRSGFPLRALRSNLYFQEYIKR